MGYHQFTLMHMSLIVSCPPSFETLPEYRKDIVLENATSVLTHIQHETCQRLGEVFGDASQFEHFLWEASDPRSTHFSTLSGPRIPSGKLRQLAQEVVDHECVSFLVGLYALEESSPFETSIQAGDYINSVNFSDTQKQLSEMTMGKVVEYLYTAVGKELFGKYFRRLTVKSVEKATDFHDHVQGTDVVLTVEVPVDDAQKQVTLAVDIAFSTHQETLARKRKTTPDAYTMRTVKQKYKKAPFLPGNIRLLHNCSQDIPALRVIVALAPDIWRPVLYALPQIMNDMGVDQMSGEVLEHSFQRAYGVERGQLLLEKEMERMEYELLQQISGPSLQILDALGG